MTYRAGIDSRRFFQSIETSIFYIFATLQLNDEQLEKRRIRRERNKVAASKCRMKRKEQALKLDEVLFNAKQNILHG